MAIAPVAGQEAQGTGAAGVASATLAGVTAGNCLIATCTNASGSTNAFTVTDTNGNTWNRLSQGSQSGATNSRVEIWAALNVNAGSTPVTATSGSTAATLHVREWSGVASAGATDVATGAGLASPSTTIGNSGSPQTTTNANDLLIVAGNFTTTGRTATHDNVGGIWTEDTRVTTGSQINLSAYAVVAATGSYSDTWTITAGTGTATGWAFASLKAAAAAVPTDYRGAVTADTPVAYWRLGETSGTTAVAEVGSLNGTYTGGPFLGVAGLLNNDANTAVNLNGSSQYVQASDTGLPSGNAAWSLEAWVKTSTSAANAGVVGYGTQSGTGDINLALNGGALAFFSHSGTNSFGGAFADGVRHHLVLTYDGTTMLAYADGAQVGSSYTPGARNIVLGNGVEIGVWSNFFTGTIDEVAIYPTALTAAKIRRHYDAASKYALLVIGDGPVAYWRLGERSGTVASDSTGTNTGTYVGAPTLGAAAALTGDNDAAVALDGSSQYINVTHGSSLNVGNGPLSYEVWMKSTLVGAGSQTLMIKGAGTARLKFNVGAVGRVAFFSTTAAVSAAGFEITDTNWHHIVGTKDASNNWLIYVDGVDRSTVTASPTTADNTTDLAFGVDNDGAPSEFFNGSIDEVAVYNKALTPAQVAAHNAAGRGPGGVAAAMLGGL